MQPDLTRRTAQSLAAAAPSPGRTVMVGLDAFVDEIIRVVDRRLGEREYLPVERLSDLGARIAAAAGLGTNMELVVERVKLGGNGPIMANALAALGMDTTCIGPLGEGSIHPAFAEIAARALADRQRSNRRRLTAGRPKDGCTTNAGGFIPPAIPPERELNDPGLTYGIAGFR